MSPIRLWRALVATACLLAWSAPPTQAAGDSVRGATLFQACIACHSVAPGVQMTGPSLAKIWGRKAGTVPGFARYSDVMKHADLTWNEATLEKWLADPDAFMPGTTMTFPGIRNGQSRQDLAAYLHAVSEGKAAQPKEPAGGITGMRSPRENLKNAPPEGRVTSLTHCKDTYTVTTADGKINQVWEFNLRLKTDSSELGPEPGKPVILGAGMQGDRASVVFATPGEISRYITEQCP